MATPVGPVGASIPTAAATVIAAAAPPPAVPSGMVVVTTGQLLQSRVAPISYLREGQTFPTADDVHPVALHKGRLVLLDHNKRVAQFNRTHGNVAPVLSYTDYFSGILDFVALWHNKQPGATAIDTMTCTDAHVQAYIESVLDPAKSTSTTIAAVLKSIPFKIDLSNVETNTDLDITLSLAEIAFKDAVPRSYQASPAEPIESALGAFVLDAIAPASFASLIRDRVKARADRKRSQPITVAEVFAAARDLGSGALVRISQDAKSAPAATTKSEPPPHSIARASGPRTDRRSGDRGAQTARPTPVTATPAELGARVRPPFACHVCASLGAPTDHAYKDCPNGHFVHPMIDKLRNPRTPKAVIAEIVQQAIALRREADAPVAAVTGPRSLAPLPSPPLPSSPPSSLPSSSSAATPPAPAPTRAPAVRSDYNTRSKFRASVTSIDVTSPNAPLPMLAPSGDTVTLVTPLVPLDVTVNGATVRALIDSGATSNVVDLATARAWQAAGIVGPLGPVPAGMSNVGGARAGSSIGDAVATTYVDLDFPSLPGFGTSPPLVAPFIVVSELLAHVVVGRNTIHALLARKRMSLSDCATLLGLEPAAIVSLLEVVPPGDVAERAAPVAAHVPLVTHPAEDPDIDDPHVADPDYSALFTTPAPTEGAPYAWDLSNINDPTATPEDYERLRSELDRFAARARDVLADPSGKPVGFTNIPPYDGAEFDHDKLSRLGHQRQPMKGSAPAMVAAARRHVAAFLAAGALVLATAITLFSSPLFFIPKGADDVRAVFNYVKVNECLTNTQVLHGPTIDETRHSMQGAHHLHDGRPAQGVPPGAHLRLALRDPLDELRGHRVLPAHGPARASRVRARRSCGPRTTSTTGSSRALGPASTCTGTTCASTPTPSATSSPFSPRSTTVTNVTT